MGGEEFLEHVPKLTAQIFSFSFWGVDDFPPWPATGGTAYTLPRGPEDTWSYLLSPKKSPYRVSCKMPYRIVRGIPEEEAPSANNPDILIQRGLDLNEVLDAELLIYISVV